MEIPDYLKPTHSGIKDVLVKSSEKDWIPIDPDGQALVKPLWTSPDSGGWAVLYHWKQGFCAPAHKHLGAIHVFIVSGKLQLRDTQLCSGDYVYEPNGIVHDATTALEDTVHLNIADGPVAFFDEKGITQYFGWEQVEQMRQGQ